MKDIKLSDFTVVPIMVFSGLVHVESFPGLTVYAIDNTSDRNLAFTISGSIVYSYHYSSDGMNYDLVDSKDYGGAGLSNCIVDTTRKILFTGASDGWVRAYPYDDNGDIGTLISSYWAGGPTNGMDIDIDNLIVFCAVGSGSGARKISSLTYNTGGTLLSRKDLNYGGNTNTIVIDRIIQGGFCGVEGTPNTTAFTYDNDGTLHGADTYNTSNFGKGVDVNEELKILFLAHVNSGLSTISYDDAALLISTLDTKDVGGAGWDVAIDPINKVAHLANYGNGLDVFTYEDDGTLTYLENHSVTGNATKVIYDEINGIVFVNSNNLNTFKYQYIETPGTELTGVPWDLYFEDGDLVIINEVDYLQQKIGIKLKFFYQEWFLDTTKGVDYFGMVFIKNPNLNAIDNMIKITILEIEEIIELLEYTSSYNIPSRILSINFKVNTIYGEISFQQEIII